MDIYTKKEELEKGIDEDKGITINKDNVINFYKDISMKDIYGKEVIVPIIVFQSSINMLESQLQMAISEKSMAENQMKNAIDKIAEIETYIGKLK